tara:strand:+ start:240 stop:3347 length:3108 start_codon:yes stop_codon:yes gene_type:complete
MIGKDGLENQKKINEELSATDKAILEAGRKAAQLTEESRSLTAELKDQLGIRSKNSEDEKTLLSLSRQITKSAQENKVALRESSDITKQLKTDRKTLAAVGREQLILERTIGDQVDENGKTAKENAAKIAEINNSRNSAQQNIFKTLEKISTASGDELSQLLVKNKNQQTYLEGLDKGLQKQLSTASAETQRLALANGLVIAAGKNVDEGVKQEEAQNKINKSMGVAGGLVAGLNAVAGKFAGAFGLKEVEAEMRKVAAATVDAEGKVNRLKTLGAGLKVAFKNFGDTLTDPSVIFGALMKGFTAVEKEQQNFRRLTGQSADAFRGINGSLTTTSEYLAGMVTLTKELGVNANVVFSPENVTTVAELTANMGMAGKEAANLAALSKVSGTNLQGNLKSTEGQFQNFVKTNKVALNFGQVLSGVANASDSVKLSLGGSQEKIGEAVMEAQKLGLTLNQVDKIADSLLNFQSSIEAEMEAELLTGQAINLEKARELALNNDLAGVAKEIGNNQAVLAAFSSGNRKAQEATAKAMGMTREEMSGMILQQKLQGNLSIEQAAAAAGISVEEAQRLTTQQQITKSIEKMTQALAPVIGFFASLLSNSMVLYTVIAALATVYATKLVVSISNTLTMLGLQTAAQEKDNATKIRGTLVTIKDTVVKYASIAATAAWNVITSIGTAIQNSSVLSFIKKGAILVATTAYKYASIAAQVTWNAIVGAGNLIMAAGNMLMNTQIGRYIALNAQKLIDTIRTWAGVGATFAQAGANATLSTSQTVLGTTGAAAGGGMAAAGAGLNAFGIAAAPAIPIILAIGAALLMASPAIYAFSFVIEALGNVIVGVLQAIPPIITAIANGFVTMMGAITFEKVALLPLLGLGFVALAAGVVAMAVATPFIPIAAFGLWLLSYALDPLGESIAKLAPNLVALSSGLVSLAGIAPTLFAVGAGLGAISLGLASMALTGLLALPVIGALTALGAVGGGSMFGGSEESGGESSGGSSTMAGVEAKLDKLISIVEAGGDVFIDGNKVGKTIQLSSSKMG